MEFLKKNYHLFIFGIFSILCASIFFFIFPYGDDFYYMTFVEKGLDYFIKENIFHYTKTNGRAIVHLIDELILADKTFIVPKVFLTFSTVSCVFLGSRIVSINSDNKNSFKIALASLSIMFSIIDIGMLNQSVFFITGAMNYLFPIPITLLYFLCYLKIKKTHIIPRFLFVLAFFSSILIEQCGFLCLCISFLILIEMIRVKKLDYKAILIIIFSILGFSLMIFAPGNFVRTTYHEDFYNTELFSRLLNSTGSLFKLLLSKKGLGVFISIFLLLYSILLFKKSKKVGSIICLISATIQLVHTLIIDSIVSLTVSLVPFIISLIIVFIFEIKEKNTIIVLLLLGAGLVQCAMILSPIIGPRTVLISLILIQIVSTMNIVKIISNLKSVKMGICISTISIIIIVLAFVPKIVGYSKNYIIQKENYNEINSSYGNETIKQYYLIDENCKYTMPYDSTYHEYWYKIANHINENVKIEYVEK